MYSLSLSVSGHLLKSPRWSTQLSWSTKASWTSKILFQRTALVASWNSATRSLSWAGTSSSPVHAAVWRSSATLTSLISSLSQSLTSPRLPSWVSPRSLDQRGAVSSSRMSRSRTGQSMFICRRGVWLLRAAERRWSWLDMERKCRNVLLSLGRISHLHNR